MKKVILFFAVAMCSVLMMAQTNQITWVNGRAVLGQSISSIDSIKYGTIEKSQKLELWLPETIVVHDTVKIPYIVHDTVIVHDIVIVHDTIIINKCDSSHAPEGVEMVDLGLPSGLKWANMNVGATSPEGYGDYFAWGEIEPKTTYDWSTYKYCKGSSSTMTKYCTSSSYGTVDNKTTLELADDAAHVNWGGNWRMPTRTEQNELRNNCTWTWTTQNGVNGYLVTSKTNSNSIFLPASGYRINSSLSYVGYGYYWSSSLYEDGSSNSYQAYCLDFYSGGVAWGSSDKVVTRDYGQSVRPVCQ